LKKKPITKRAGGVAQGVGPEVQAPVLKKKKKKERKKSTKDAFHRHQSLNLPTHHGNERLATLLDLHWPHMSGPQS
jgi:hypothetical protein